MTDPTPAAEVKQLVVRLWKLVEIRSKLEDSEALSRDILARLEALKKPGEKTLARFMIKFSRELWILKTRADSPAWYLGPDFEGVGEGGWPIAQRIILDQLLSLIGSIDPPRTFADKADLMWLVADTLDTIEEALEMLDSLERLITDTANKHP